MKTKKWFITGISSGLGKAMAETIIKKGDFVIGTFRKQEQVDAFNQNIDVLVNNAGIGFTGAIEETSIQEFKTVFDVNFFGLLKLTQAVLPSMRKNQSGHIVQISSHAGIKATPGFGVYNASKFALEGMSEALAHELKPLGIKVIIVEPGPFRTNFAGSSLQESKTRIEDYSDTATLFRSKLKSVHNLQEGHPYKAAQAIYDHVNTNDSTLRLPLGKIPMSTIQAKIDSLQNDLDKNRVISESTIYE